MKKIIPITLVLAALTGCGGNGQRKEELQGMFIMLGTCIEFNDTITRRIAEIDARGLTTVFERCHRLATWPQSKIYRA